jgi:hypothetical protein
VAEARKNISDPLKDLEAGGRLLRHFYGYIIFRASSEAIHLEKLRDDQKLAVIGFFDQAGGKMFLSHFLKLLIRMIRDGAKDDANDFYDMLQLLLLSDPNLLFVTEDRPFFQYYVGAEHHRIVRWKGLKIHRSVPTNGLGKRFHDPPPAYSGSLKPSPAKSELWLE